MQRLRLLSNRPGCAAAKVRFGVKAGGRGGVDDAAAAAAAEGRLLPAGGGGGRPLRHILHTQQRALS